MDLTLLQILTTTQWQWVNLVSCALGSICAGTLCLVALDPDGRRVVQALRWASAALSSALGVVSIAEIETLLLGYRHHMPTEVLLNVATAVFLVTLAWMRLHPNVNDRLN